jgi:disease resistance protein RPM1
MEGAIFSLTEATVRSLLCKLVCLLSQGSWLVQGVRGELQFIKDELESMNAFLRTLTMSEGHDDQVRIWMKQVKEIAYDAEDCIDAFTHHLFEPLGMAFHRRMICMLHTLGCRHRIAIQLQELKTRVQDIGERRSRYGVVLPKAVLRGGGLQHANHASLHLDPQLHALFTEEAQLVGIDEPRDALVKWLMEDDLRLRVLSIVGFGGLGKTTLARMVCESPLVKSADFQCCPLFIVARNCNIRALFQHMIRELIQQPHKAMAIAGGKYGPFTEENLEGINRWEGAILVDKLKRYLQNKRYFVSFR